MYYILWYLKGNEYLNGVGDIVVYFWVRFFNDYIVLLVKIKLFLNLINYFGDM